MKRFRKSAIALVLAVLMALQGTEPIFVQAKEAIEDVQKNADFSRPEALTEEEVIRRIHSYPWKRLTITGGEPMLHPIHHFCEVLGKEGYEINIETNGAVPLWRERPEGVFYTMDFKCSGSGMKSHMNLDNFKLLNGNDVLKFVVSSKEDLDEMKDVVEHHFTAARHPQFFVSPVWGRIQPDKLVEYVRNHQLQDVRVQVQLHKIIWDPDRRGV